MPAGKANRLYYGDNLDVLRRHIEPGSANLIYLDPPFNAARDFNAFFQDRDGASAASQLKAFTDSWEWNAASAAAYEEVVVGGGKISEALQALRWVVGATDMLAYLSMMAPRLIELHRVLAAHGALYLHCDPTASHYLRVLLDSVFGPENFRNEIVWQRTTAKSLSTRRLPSNHDVILAYQKTAQHRWNHDAAFLPYDASDLDAKTLAKYTHRDENGRRYQLDNLTNPNHDRPNLRYEFLGVTKVWRWTKDRMQAAYDAGLVVQTGPGKVPRFKRYLDEQRGKPLGDVWADIPPLNSQAAERLGYPTQKPEALLERIISLSSAPGDVVLDPFCGCGTAITVAQKLGRKWIGVDVSAMAVSLIRNRLRTTFGKAVDFEVRGEPVTVQDAAQLATEDPYGFQWWVLGLVGARPTEEKKGADRGIDGKLFFVDGVGVIRTVVFSVKAGRLQAGYVRDLLGVVHREKAAIGVLLSMQEPTIPMQKEAASAGFFASNLYGTRHPVLQILTVNDLLSGRQIDMPPLAQVNATYQHAPKANESNIDYGRQMALG